MNITSLIRAVPNFPKPGVMFRDITTLLKDAEGFHFVIDQFAVAYRNQKVDKIAAIESRGFIVGAALAHELRVEFAGH